MLIDVVTVQHFRCLGNVLQCILAKSSSSTHFVIHKYVLCGRRINIRRVGHFERDSPAVIISIYSRTIAFSHPYFRAAPSLERAITLRPICSSYTTNMPTLVEACLPSIQGAATGMLLGYVSDTTGWLSQLRVELQLIHNLLLRYRLPNSWAGPIAVHLQLVPLLYDELGYRDYVHLGVAARIAIRSTISLLPKSLAQPRTRVAASLDNC